MDELDASNLGEKKVIDNVSNEINLSKKEIDSKYAYFFMKRLIDILGSFVGLIVLSPLFLVVSYKIKKEDPEGPVFFSKTELEKMEKFLKCISFDLCV